MNFDRIMESVIILLAAAVLFAIIFQTEKREALRERTTCSTLLVRAPNRLDSLEIVLQVPSCQRYLAERVK